MNRFKSGWALALALVATVDSARAVQSESRQPVPSNSAQPGTSDTLREPPHGSRTYNPVDAERTLAEFSDCVLDRGGRRARAGRFLRLPPGGEAFNEAAERLTPEECLLTRGGTYMEMSIRADVLRASLFAAMYKREFARVPPSPELSTIPPLLLRDEFDGDLAMLPESVRVMRGIGDCSARLDPVGAHDFLLTTLGSSEERRTLERVTTALANCLPEGHQLRFTRAVLRGMLGEALYKLRRAAAGETPAPPT
ncbi:MAG: hypothetical protein M3177_10230, partial [Pseudomonadota bacterium]|nr:hypothetical protein [Pseudomonadota bacterium]